MKRTTIAVTALWCAFFLSMGGCKKADEEELETPVNSTPVQHSNISPKPPKGCGSPFFSIHYNDAYKTLREAEDYQPGLRKYYVRELSDRRNEYLLAGISPELRDRWLTSHHIQEKDRPCLVPLFDEIGAAAKRTLPSYHPRGYTHHDSDEEKLIREAVKAQIPDAEVLGVGVKSPTWQIEKLNNGTPRSRYKYGMAWVKSPKFDDGYCRIAYANVVQDYSGGGTYGESQARYVSMEPAGCK